MPSQEREEREETYSSCIKADIGGIRKRATNRNIKCGGTSRERTAKNGTGRMAKENESMKGRSGRGKRI
jgi:hypothetical protein